MNSWGLPPDGVSWVCATLGVVLLALAPRGVLARALLRPRPTWFLTALCALTAALSVGYFYSTLGGAPRVIDATAYWLEAKLFAAGQVEFAPAGPGASFHSRFLLSTARGGLAPLFPPGYPVVLGLAMALGVPYALGPLLGAVLTLLTYFYARKTLANELGARLAACMSCSCAVLRYHTADTMTHAWCAVLLLGALLAAEHAKALAAQFAGLGRALAWAAASGVFMSWIFATRPLSVLPLGVGLLLLYGRRWKLLLGCGVGVVPGLFLLLWEQRTLTGHWGHWAQHLYYDASDGPPGCVRLGFGPNIGCRVEHGEFMARYMPRGFDLAAAVGTTGRRLAMHLNDAGNVFVVLLLIPVALWFGRRNTALLRAALIVALQIAVYVVFYFDANVPGAGARLYVDTLPLEHVLLASAAAQLGFGTAVLGVMWLGFAVHGVFSHRDLARHQGGAPMFEEALVAADTRLLFMDTDHGFNLAFTPPAHTERVVARLRGDAYDRALWEHLGRPKAEVYDFDLDGQRAARLLPFTPSPQWRFEAESSWPGIRTQGGWVEPKFVASSCASKGRVLQLHPVDEEGTDFDLELWVPDAGRYRLRVLAEGQLEIRGLNAPLRRQEGACPTWLSEPVSLPAGAWPLRVHAVGEASLDAFELLPL